MEHKVISLIIVTFLLVLVINTISAQTNSIENAGHEEFIEGDEEPVTENEGFFIWKKSGRHYVEKYGPILLAILITIITTLIIFKGMKKIKNKIWISGIIATIPILIGSLLPFLLRVPCPGFEYGFGFGHTNSLICNILQISFGIIFYIFLAITPAAYLVFMYFLVRKNKLSKGLLKWFISSNAYFFFIYLISWILVIEAREPEAGFLFLFTIPYALVMMIITFIETIIVRRKIKK